MAGSFLGRESMRRRLRQEVFELGDGGGEVLFKRVVREQERLVAS